MQSRLTRFFLFSFCLFQGGLAPGGFNFDAKLSVLLYLNVLIFLFVCFIFFLSVSLQICRRRESTDVEDLFIAHIAGMDTLARGLRNAVKLIEVTQDPSFTSIVSLIIQMCKLNESL